MWYTHKYYKKYQHDLHTKKPAFAGFLISPDLPYELYLIR